MEHAPVVLHIDRLTENWLPIWLYITGLAAIWTLTDEDKLNPFALPLWPLTITLGMLQLIGRRTLRLLSR